MSIKNFNPKAVFETENTLIDDQSQQLSIDFQHKISIVVCLVLYHVGFMMFEYGATRSKSA